MKHLVFSKYSVQCQLATNPREKLTHGSFVTMAEAVSDAQQAVKISARYRRCCVRPAGLANRHKRNLRCFDRKAGKG